MQQVHLSDAETKALSLYTAQLDGFVAGAQALAAHLKNQMIQQILKARTAQPAPPDSQNQ